MLLFLLTFALAADPFAGLLDDLQTGTCPGPPPGADSWFIGDFTIADDGSVTGTERWVLRPNHLWAERGAVNCEITWMITGTVVQPGACASCEKAIAIHARPDIVDSQCPKELLTGRVSNLFGAGKVGGEANEFDVAYDIRLNANGTARFTFSKSGTLLGEGVHADGRVAYRSAHLCKFF